MQSGFTSFCYSSAKLHNLNKISLIKSNAYIFAIVKHLIYPIIFTLLLLSCSPSGNQEPIIYSGYTQGTTFSITIFGEINSYELQSDIDSILDLITKTASVYDSNSIISMVNRNEPVTLNHHFTYIFNRSREVSDDTDGAFDITIGPLVNAWGFRQKQGLYLDKQLVDNLLGHTGFRKIDILGNEIQKSDSLVQIDFNAIAQGYTVDVLASYLESKDLYHYLIDVGGEIRAGELKPGGEKWIVAIEKPAENDSAAQTIQQTIAITNKSIATSGNYRNYFFRDGIKYAHTINPATGYPIHNNLLSVTVIANDCISADAYATAFMVMGLKQTLAYLKNHPEMDAFLILSQPDGTYIVKFSTGFQSFMTRL